MSKCSPFRYIKTSSEIIRLAVIMYVHFPLSLRDRRPTEIGIERRELSIQAGQSVVYCVFHVIVGSDFTR